jgi:hypothetical protein
MLGGYGSIGDFPNVLPKIPSIIQSIGGATDESIKKMIVSI